MTRPASPGVVHRRDLRGAARLATDATVALADVVEAMHARIARVPLVGAPGDRTRGITGFVYDAVRGVARRVGGGVDASLAALEAALPSRTAEAALSPQREAIVAALNGVMGDHLVHSANPLAIRMALRVGGRVLPLEREALAAALPEAGGRVVVLVHGLCMNDLQCRHGPLGHDHGAALGEALGFTPVYLHYASGLHVSTNGREFAQLLEALLQAWPRPLERFAIVGHSMGGLVARSALHQARAAGHAWPAKLDDLVFLGTPHHGAPLERAGHGLELLLSALPYAAPLARVATLRSAGITDLRHGNLLDEDWEGADRFAHSADRRTVVPLPERTRCHAFGGTTGGRPGDLKDTLAGDGLVPLASALGRHRLARRTLAFAPGRRHVFARTGHLQLLSSPEVFEQLVRSLAP